MEYFYRYLYLLPFCFICYPSLVFSNTQFAKAILLRGEVKAIDPASKQEITLKKDDWITKGQVVKTEKKSFVKLILQDKSEVNLGPESEMVVDKTEGKDTSVVSLIKGQVRANVTKDILQSTQTGDPKLFVQTKSAAMGVRGTDFQVVFNEVNSITSLVTFSGDVSLATSDPKEVNLSTPPSFESLNVAVSSDKAVSVTEGQYSGANPQLEQPSLPVKVSPAQVESMKANETFKEASAEGDTSAKRFNSPIPPGVSTKAFVSESPVTTTAAPVAASSTTTPSTVASTAPPPEGVVDAKTGTFAPPAGGFVDLKTGLYVPPPPGSTFDANTGVYVPPPTVGKFDPSTGSYVPPQGLQLNPTGTFSVVETKTPEVSASGGSGTGPSAPVAPPPAFVPPPVLSGGVPIFLPPDKGLFIADIAAPPPVALPIMKENAPAAIVAAANAPAPGAANAVSASTGPNAGSTEKKNAGPSTSTNNPANPAVAANQLLAPPVPVINLTALLEAQEKRREDLFRDSQTTNKQVTLGPTSDVKFNITVE